VPPERLFWSPYSGEDANCGNVLLISLEGLVEDGLLRPSDLPAPVPFAPGADFAAVAAVKEPVLKKAAANLLGPAGSPALVQEFNSFCEEQAPWLDDAALFSILCLQNEGAWWEWEPELRDRSPRALEAARSASASAIQEFKCLQFLFHRQWMQVREYANQKGVKLVGDMPIYVGGHSADVWAHRALFEVAQDGTPAFVSGVPPDAFSETGQLWGSPLYDWPAHQADEYRWWVQRLGRAFQLFDEMRIDHFRGFAGYWAVAASEDTAMVGKWRRGPGRELFDVLREALPGMTILAEDLGVITPDVVQLREDIGAPGMVVLQFAFDGNPKNPHLPHNHYKRCFAYAGTHDNETTLGWYLNLPHEAQDRVLEYLDSTGSDISWGMIRETMVSVADTAIFTLQDVMGLDNTARMNTPGVAEGNWAWRAGPAGLWQELQPEARRLRAMAEAYGRLSP